MGDARPVSTGDRIARRGPVGGACGIGFGLLDPPIIAGTRGSQALTRLGQAGARSAENVILPAAVALEAFHLANSAWKDHKRDTTRNTTGNAVSATAGIGGGYGGAIAGAALGSAIVPGVGTLIGGIVGGLFGGVGGSVASQEVFDAVSDAFDYDLEDADNPCRGCKARYQYRKYLGKDPGYCEDCLKEMS